MSTRACPYVALTPSSVKNRGWPGLCLQFLPHYDSFANTSFNGDLIIPDLVTEIGNYAFNSVGFDGKLKLPSGLERIEDGTFMCCKFTGLLELPNSVTYIGNHAFYQNQFAGIAIIPENVTYIGRDFAFGWYSEDAAFNCFFKGDAPEIHIAAFEGHRTTVYYPQNASGWSDVINKDYDVPEPITWLAICENHDLLEWNAYQEPTCTTEGVMRRDCSRCDYFETEAIPANGHAEVTMPGKAATCTEPGLTEGKKCSVCGEVTVPQNTIPAKDHQWQDATCKAPKTCAVCRSTSGKKARHTYNNNVDGTCNFCEVNRETVENRQVHHMLRMYNPNTGEHFYTGSEEERDMLIEAGWQYEGVAFTFPRNTGAPVHRLFEPITGEHLYTMDEAEKDRLMAEGWNYEGVAFNSAYDTEAVQHRLHNPNASVGAYHFTFSEEEKQNLINAGWEYQGIGWYSCWK